MDQLEQENREEKHNAHQLRGKNADLTSRLMTAKSACKAGNIIGFVCYSFHFQWRNYRMHMNRLKQNIKKNQGNCIM